MAEDFHGLIKLPGPRPNTYNPRTLDAGLSRGGQIWAGAHGPGVISGLAMGGPAMAHGLARWADQLQAQEERKRQLDAMAAMAESQDRERAAFEQMKKMNGAAGFEAPAFLENFYRQEEKSLQGQARGSIQKDMYASFLRQSRDNGLNLAYRHRAAQLEAYEQDVFQGQMLKSQAYLENHPTQWKKQLENQIGLIGQMNPDRDNRARNHAAAKALTGSAIESMVAGGDFAGARAELENMRSVLSPADLADLEGRFERARVSHRQEFQAITGQLGDWARAEDGDILANGLGNERLPEMWAAAEKGGFISAGSTARYEARRAAMREARGWLTASERSDKSIQTLLAEAQALSPDGRELADDDIRQAKYEAVNKELRRRQDALNQDPMGEVKGQVAEAVRRMSEAGLLDPEDPKAVFDAQVRVGRQLAARRGVEVSGAGRVLPAGQVIEYSQALAGAGSEPERLEILSGLNDMFGEHAELAFNDLKVPYSDRLRVAMNGHPDPEMRKYARLSFARGEYKNLQGAGERAVRDGAVGLVEENEYARMLGARLRANPRDENARAQLDGLYELAENLALEVAETRGAPNREVKKMLSGLTGDRVAAAEDYALIYLPTGPDGRADDKEAVLRGLSALSHQMGDDYYWTNDGDERFVLVSHRGGLVQTVDGKHNFSVSRADAAYVGGFPVKTAGHAELAAQVGSTGLAARLARAREVADLIPTSPPSDDYSRYIEMARKNTEAGSAV